jgi:hypothetical protein
MRIVLLLLLCILQITVGDTEEKHGAQTKSKDMSDEKIAEEKDTSKDQEPQKDKTKQEENNKTKKSGKKSEEYSDYIKADDVLYKTLFKPRDCINPLTLDDNVTMNMEWGATTSNQKITMDTSVALRIEAEGITFKLDHKGLEGMCLGERRNLVIPEDKISFKEKFKRTGLQTVLTIELVEVNNLRWQDLENGLKMVLLEKVDAQSCGRIVIYGDTLAVEYEGSLEDGTVFDSSESRGQPFGPFLQGHHQIIRGYEIALAGRCLGERFKMVVPPNLAYGQILVRRQPWGDQMRG